MGLIYGEGKGNACKRLREEIDKASKDKLFGAFFIMERGIIKIVVRG